MSGEVGASGIAVEEHSDTFEPVGTGEEAACQSCHCIRIQYECIGRGSGSWAGKWLNGVLGRSRGRFEGRWFSCGGHGAIVDHALAGMRAR